MELKDIKFPYYSGNIRFTKVQGYVNLYQFIYAHRNPKLSTIQTIRQVQAAEKLNFKKLKRKLKHNLYSFTPSVYIAKDYKRKYENVLEWTGLMQLDFDKIPDLNTAIEIKHYVFSQPETITCFLSPSGKGVKAIIKIKKPEDKEHYKAIHKAVSKKYNETGYFDEATKNAMLPLFLSLDYEIFYKSLSRVTEWVKEDWNKPDYVSLNNAPPKRSTTNFNSLANVSKTLRIFRDKINNINDNGHTQLRSACLILGSRVGAGYIDDYTAREEAERLIKNNNYLSKGTSGYISTAYWAISEGSKNPKYYD